MKARARMRTVVKWGGVVVLVGLVVVWVGSGWWSVTWVGGPQAKVGLYSGCIHVRPVGSVTTPDPWGWSAEFKPWYVQWGWEWDWFAGRLWRASVPLWILVGVVGGVTWMVWRRDARAQRRREGKCAGCGYDLAGLGRGARCPECGVAR